MSDDPLEVVDTVAGFMLAEVIRGLLESQGIAVIMSPGFGHTFTLTVGPAGEVQILTAHEDAGRARQILQAYYAGTLEEVEPADPEDLFPDAQG